MISVTRLDGSNYFLNAELIQSVEATPDSVITLTNNTKVIVRESVKEIISSIMDYKRQINNSVFQKSSGD